jgi:hypothetical protein
MVELEVKVEVGDVKKNQMLTASWIKYCMLYVMTFEFQYNISLWKDWINPENLRTKNKDIICLEI